MDREVAKLDTSSLQKFSHAHRGHNEAESRPKMRCPHCRNYEFVVRTKTFWSPDAPILRRVFAPFITHPLTKFVEECQHCDFVGDEWTAEEWPRDWLENEQE